MSQEVEKRKVVVHKNVGQAETVIETAASTWGQLQKELQKAGISTSNMEAMIGENQNNLTSPHALLLQTNMTLFLVNKQVKSGL